MKIAHYLLFSFMVLLFFGCSDLLTCIIPKEPELGNKEFPIGSINTYYYVDLDAGIRNEPRDNDYDYFFDVEGLPLGLSYYVNFRTISIEGLPIEPGTYDITIYLEVDGPFRNQDDDVPEMLCGYTTSKTYNLIIE